VKDVEVEISFLPEKLMEQSLSNWDRNNFFKFLSYHLDDEYVEAVMKKYLVGTSRHWYGATIFWQKDINGRVRQAKVMHYDDVTGKRTKSSQLAQKYGSLGTYFDDINNGDKVAFIGKKILKNNHAHLKQCFFGEHLLTNKIHKKVGVVESEKTAIIASLFMPQFIWIATGGLNGCKWYDPDVFKVLQGHDVFLFPDVGAYSSWKEASEKIQRSLKCNIVTSEILEDSAQGYTDCKGWDLADFILRSNAGSNTWVGPEKYPII
jgi:hypothetical protein